MNQDEGNAELVHIHKDNEGHTLAMDENLDAIGAENSKGARALPERGLGDTFERSTREAL